jgi:hypothetical protein
MIDTANAASSHRPMKQVVIPTSSLSHCVSHRPTKQVVILTSSLSHCVSHRPMEFDSATRQLQWVEGKKK